MKRILLNLILLPLVAYAGGPVNAQDDNSPGIDVNHAIAGAVSYAEKNDIDLHGKYIKKVEYRNAKVERPYWLVYWVNKRITKGGEVELKLYSDGSVEVRYHK